MKDCPMAGISDEDRQAESRRILDRVSREAHSAAFGLFGRGVEKARRHVAAADADQNDRIELWGTRIGRSIGLLVLATFLVWILIYLAAGA
jgi:hypothetical protein